MHPRPQTPAICAVLAEATSKYYKRLHATFLMKINDCCGAAISRSDRAANRRRDADDP
jgi:hypothetical protein